MSSKGNKAKNVEKANKSIVDEEPNISVNQIRQLFMEMFKTHEENIIKIISANNKIVNDRIDMLEKKIGDIQESMEFTESNFKVKLTQFEDKQVEINQQMKEKLREMEDRSRRNNLRIDGVNESENESWKDTKQKTLGYLSVIPPPKKL